MRAKPVRYSRKIARRYCALIAEGYSQAGLRNAPGMPVTSTAWLWTRDHPEFARMLAAARARRARTAALAGVRDPSLGGRPSLYTAEMGERICELVAGGMSLNDIAALPDMPSIGSIHNWKREHEAFERMYLDAWETHTQTVGEEVIRIADEALGADWSPDRIGAREALAAAKLKIDARISRVMKLAPKTLLRAEKAVKAGKSPGELTYAERLALLD